MKYYVTTDLHGFFTEFKEALTEAGYFEDDTEHKLIICGDLYDRGPEALELQNFILELMARDKLILIRGNHEDLSVELLKNWKQKSYEHYHNLANGTVDTVCQLTGMTKYDLFTAPSKVQKSFENNPYIRTIIPTMLDYYETKNYIFTHGWIPCSVISHGPHQREYAPIAAWREADQRAWEKARWINGMEAAHSAVFEKDKTIVCGHWHSSFGHSKYKGDGSEFDDTANFSPYHDEGIIALDACTVVSGKVSVIIIEDEDLA